MDYSELVPGCLFRLKDDDETYKLIGWNTMGTHIIYVNYTDFVNRNDDLNGLLDITEPDNVGHIIGRLLNK